MIYLVAPGFDGWIVLGLNLKTGNFDIEEQGCTAEEVGQIIG